MTADPLRQAAADIMRLGVSVIDIQTRLHKETPKDEIKWREGPKGRQLAYVDARYIMDTLDEAVGPDNWQTQHRMEGAKVSCSIGIRIDGEWIWKSDGAGETDIEGEKGSFSDALKRAAVSWGIGRDLYSLGQRAGAPVQRPQAPTRPVAVPDTDLSADEVYGDPHSDDEGYCPDHDLPWSLKPGGVSKKTGNAYDPFYACGFKPERGQPYCNNKPPRAWLARHEVS